MRRTALIIVLTLLILALAAGMALAAGPNSLWVNGVEIVHQGTATNGALPAGVSYDAANGILTLDGANLTTTGRADAAISYTDGDLEIVLKGYNIIDVDDVDNKDGIKVNTGSLTISGGSLDIRASRSGILMTCVRNVIRLDSGLIRKYARAGTTTIINSELTITAAKGFDAEGDVKIINSSLTIPQAASTGMEVKCGDLYIDDSDILIAKAGNSGIEVVRGYAVISYPGWRHYIIADGNININNSQVKVVDGGNYGIIASGIIDIAHSRVSAYGAIAAILSGFTDGPGIRLSSELIVLQGGRAAEIRGRWEPMLLDSSVGDKDIPLDEEPDGASSIQMFFDPIPPDITLQENTLLGWTFSAQSSVAGERATVVHVYYDKRSVHPAFIEYYSNLDDASQTVVIGPFEDIAAVAVPILSGTGKHFPFIDVGLNHWAYQDIFDAFKKGLINGKTETLYMPDGDLTYAEAIKLAACIHQLNSMGAVSFEPSQPWYQTYVSYAELNEIILPGEFSGQMNDAISRYDFAHIFGKALPVSAFAPLNAIDSIPDVPSSNRHADEILMLYRAGILTGSDATGNFYGSSNIKRSEVAAIVVRMIDPEKRIRK